MWTRRPAKQRLWLGSRRHSCCGGRGYTDTDAHSHSDRHANSQPYCNSVSDAHAATDANAQSRTNGKAASHTSAERLSFPFLKFARLRVVVTGTTVARVVRGLLIGRSM